MALQYASTIYLQRLDLVESVTGASALLRIFSGAAPANCAAADSGTLLCTITLPADWMNAASGTTKTLKGTWSGTAGAGSGTTPTHFRIWDSGATGCFIQGSCGIGSGDLQVNGTITSGQTVNVTAFTLTAGNT